MWGPEKENATGRIVDPSKMVLVHFTVMGSPQSLFYDDAPEGMSDK
jgi:hypothetical protein